MRIWWCGAFLGKDISCVQNARSLRIQGFEGFYPVEYPLLRIDLRSFHRVKVPSEGLDLGYFSCFPFLATDN